MSVYYKEKAKFLREAMNSIWNQTVPTDDFILVCDGKLTPKLDAVVSKMEKAHPELTVVRLKKNGGLGNALNIGMKYCKNEIVARMDSDDISYPDRCEKQLKIFCNKPEVSIVSGIIEEFSASIDDVESKRVIPENQEEILRFARKRTPFNHACVMYKKHKVEAAGGYRDFYLLEDYYLWIRMLQNGAIGYNIQEPILWVRTGAEMYKRRSGWKYAKSQILLFKYMRNSRFISQTQYFKSVALRTVSSFVPNWIRKMLFKILLRK